MNQTAYNKGGKANFFPSTATATTNGSSGNGSTDPRRTTETGTRQPSISNQQNSTIDPSAQLKFNKNQIRLNGPNQEIESPQAVQASKYAWQAMELQSARGNDQVPGTATSNQGQPILFINNNGKTNMSTKLQQQVLMYPESNAVKTN